MMGVPEIGTKNWNSQPSLEEVGCEPVLNLAATPDEAVGIICTVC